MSFTAQQLLNALGVQFPSQGLPGAHMSWQEGLETTIDARNKIATWTTEMMSAVREALECIKRIESNPECSDKKSGVNDTTWKEIHQQIKYLLFNIATHSEKSARRAYYWPLFQAFEEQLKPDDNGLHLREAWNFLRERQFVIADPSIRGRLSLGSHRFKITDEFGLTNKEKQQVYKLADKAVEHMDLTTTHVIRTTCTPEIPSS